MSNGNKSKSSMERVKVHCRLRPYLKHEKSAEEFVKGKKSKNEVANPDVVTLKGDDNCFQFDSFLGQEIGQQEVYDKVAGPIVESVLHGYNGTIFAYGQTGSGKTYSMFGEKSNKDAGIVPRALAHIFKTVNDDEEFDYTISLSYVQLYCELLTDLLSPTTDTEFQQQALLNKKATNSLLIREDSKRGVFIEGVRAQGVNSVEEAMGYIEEGDERRVRASTNMNATSSRSHACIIVNITKRKQESMTSNNNKDRKKTYVKYGKLILVDLAGSERVKKALGDNHDVNGTRFMESKAINLSLSALGNCISALAKKNKHVPYRDAKLTRLLKDSLGGNSMTALVLNIAPHASHYSETKSTLSFGQRAMNVQTRVSINEEIDFEALYSGVQASLDQKDDRITELEIALSKLRIELDQAKSVANQAENEKSLVQMQLKTVNISSDVATQIEELQREHLSALDQAKRNFDRQVEEEKAKALSAQEEWHRIEYELKDEREEHLRTCALLREKQEQLVEMENNKGERIAELFEELKTAQEKNEVLNAQMKQAFLERNQLAEKLKQVEGELTQSKDFQERGLKLMQKLTNRVEQLERKRKDNNDHDELDDEEEERRSQRSSGTTSTSSRKLDRRISRKPALPTTMASSNTLINQKPSARTPKQSAFSQHVATKRSTASTRTSAAASILRF